MEMNDGKTMLISLALYKIEVTMRLCSAREGSITMHYALFCEENVFLKKKV